MNLEKQITLINYRKALDKVYYVYQNTGTSVLSNGSHTEFVEFAHGNRHYTH